MDIRDAYQTKLRRNSVRQREQRGERLCGTSDVVKFVQDDDAVVCT